MADPAILMFETSGVANKVVYELHALSPQRFIQFLLLNLSGRELQRARHQWQTIRPDSNNI
jgi:hypothetical protein